MITPAKVRRSRRSKPVPPTARELRREELRGQLLETVDALKRCRADLLSDKSIAEYVALDWLEWNGGALRLTLTGKNVCQQMQGQLDNTQSTASPKGRVLSRA
jgi:hypothetical protein